MCIHRLQLYAGGKSDFLLGCSFWKPQSTNCIWNRSFSVLFYFFDGFFVSFFERRPVHILLWLDIFLWYIIITFVASSFFFLLLYLFVHFCVDTYMTRYNFLYDSVNLCRCHSQLQFQLHSVHKRLPFYLQFAGIFPESEHDKKNRNDVHVWPCHCGILQVKWYPWRCHLFKQKTESVLEIVSNNSNKRLHNCTLSVCINVKGMCTVSF